MSPVLLPALARALSNRARTVLSPADKTAAAVLAPLLVVDGALHLLYTRRSTSLPTHQGQVAFPGGRRHAEDADLSATALREAQEEIGLRPEDVEILGALDDIETLGSRFVITPYVGVAPHPYAWQPCPSEVDTIFTVPLAALTAPDAEREETWDFEGRRIPIRSFPFEGQVIWGATHRITRNLLDVLETLS